MTKIYRVKLSELRKVIKESLGDEEIPGFGRDYSEFNQKKASKMIYNLVYGSWDEAKKGRLIDMLRQKFPVKKVKDIIDWVHIASNDRYEAEYGNKTQFDEDEPSERMIAEDELEKSVKKINRLLGFDFTE